MEALGKDGIEGRRMESKLWNGESGAYARQVLDAFLNSVSSVERSSQLSARKSHDAEFLRAYRDAALQQMKMGASIALIVAAVLTVAWTPFAEPNSPVTYLRLGVIGAITAILWILFFQESFCRRNYTLIFSTLFLVIVQALVLIALEVPHGEAQPLATLSNIILAYLLMFGFARLPLIGTILIALSVLPTGIYVIHLHELESVPMVSFVLNVCAFTVAGAVLAASIERRERAFFYATLRAKELAEDRKLLIAQIAHDIRTPISALQLHLAQTLASISEPQLANIGRKLRIALEAIDELSDFTHELHRHSALSLEEANGQEVEDVNLASCLAQVMLEITPEASRLGVTIEVDSAQGVTVLSSPYRLKTIFRNLLGNAIKFSDRTKSSRKVSLRIKTGARYTRIYLHDNGVGISPHQLRRIWQMGERVNNEKSMDKRGTGMGLTFLNQCCVETPGHSIKVRSVVGSGTTFMLRVPTGSYAIGHGNGAEPSQVEKHNPQQDGEGWTCAMAIGGPSIDTSILQRVFQRAAIDLFEVRSIEEASSVIEDSDVPIAVCCLPSALIVSGQLPNIQDLFVKHQGIAPVFIQIKEAENFSIVEIARENGKVKESSFSDGESLLKAALLSFSNSLTQLEKTMK